MPRLRPDGTLAATETAEHQLQQKPRAVNRDGNVSVNVFVIAAHSTAVNDLANHSSRLNRDAKTDYGVDPVLRNVSLAYLL